MLLLVASMNEFLQFLKITLWISIPLFLISTLVVVLMHYRRKKKNALIADPQPALSFAFAGGNSTLPANNSVSDFFRQQLELGKEQYNLLENDFKSIRSKYQLLINGDENEDVSVKNADHDALQKQLKQYELKIAQLHQAIEYLEKNVGANEENEKVKQLLSEKDKEVKRLHGVSEQLNREIALLRQQLDSKDNEVQKLDRLLKEMQESARHATNDARGLQISFQQQHEEKEKGHFEENQRLSEQLKQLHESFKKLEEENSELHSKLQDIKRQSVFPAEASDAAEDIRQLLIRAEEEISGLKSRLAEAGSFEEIAREKNAQLELLQSQLEQKIKLNHQLEFKQASNEKQFAQLNSELEEYGKEKGFLQEDLAIKLEELSRQQKQIEEGSAENRQLKEQLLSKEDSIALLQQEVNHFNTRINEYEQEIIRNKNIAQALEEQLKNTQGQVAAMEAKLNKRQELLASLHDQLANVVQKDDGSKSSDFLSSSLPQLAEQA